MRQVLIFLALHLVGVAICLAVGPRRRLLLCSALGFPIGLAAVVPLLMLLLAIGVPYGPITVAATMLAVTLAAALGIRAQGWPDRSAVRTLALGAAAFVVVGAVATAVNLSMLSVDSHVITSMGRAIAWDRGLSDDLLNEMGNRGGFMMVAHSFASFVGMDFLYGLAPVLGLSFAAAFTIAMWDGLELLGVDRARRLVPVVLAAGVLFTVYFVQLHFIYIHENLGSAVYLTLFVVLFWLGEVERSDRYLPVAFIAATAFTLCRIENPLAVLMFLAVVVLPSERSRRPIAIWLTASVLVAAGWIFLLGRGLPAEYGYGDRSLEPSRCYIMAALLGGFLVYWLVATATPLARLHRYVPALVAAACALALVVAFVTKTELMITTVEVMVNNLRSFDDWGLAWQGAAVLAVLGLFTPHPPARGGMVVGVPLYLAFVVIVAYSIGGYREDPYSSGTRMALHALPLAYFYVGLKLGLLNGRTGPARLGEAGS